MTNEEWQEYLTETVPMTSDLIGKLQNYTPRECQNFPLLACVLMTESASEIAALRERVRELEVFVGTAMRISENYGSKTIVRQMRFARDALKPKEPT